MSSYIKLLLIISFPVGAAQPWNWQSIDTSDIKFPNSFVWGVALSEYQNSGATTSPNSNWASWETTTYRFGSPHILNGQQSGVACDHWNRYKEDVQLAKDLGITSLRFSIAWDRIEPEEGVWDEQALQHYEDYVDECIAQGIKPMITLHHFVDPLWFTQKGAFEKEENVFYFVRFAQKMFERLGHKTKLWCTINEPTIYMFMGYVLGMFPPGHNNPVLALTVMRNLMQAHVESYRAMKAMPYGDVAEIGIVHQYLVFEPYHSWNVLEYMPGLFFNFLLNTAVLKFYKTGTFNIPLISRFTYQAPEGKLMDFIGLNYYSRVLVRGQLSFTEPIAPSHYPDEIMTDMQYAMYPQGLYQAIQKMSELGVPIYVTENGIADAKDDRRELFLKQYIYAMNQAVKDGYDVRGYYYWSLMDNFEWDQGYSQKFGLYSVDFNTFDRTLNPSAQYYIWVINNAIAKI